jgi:hypothetical protein
MITLAVLSLCYKQEPALPQTASRFGKLLADLTESCATSADSRIYPIDDGSRDRTWNLIEQFADADNCFHGIKLSRNRAPKGTVIAAPIILALGCKTAEVYYERRERCAEESKSPLRKMLTHTLKGVTSLSPAPLRMIAVIGFVVTFISAALGTRSMAVPLFTGNAIPGLAASVVPVNFLGGLQLLGIGVICGCSAKGYLEVKRRPHYIIGKIT